MQKEKRNDIAWVINKVADEFQRTVAYMLVYNNLSLASSKDREIWLEGNCLWR